MSNEKDIGLFNDEFQPVSKLDFQADSLLVTPKMLKRDLASYSKEVQAEVMLFS